MFDFSLAEMAFTALVALVVLGPKELPVVLRTLGRWVGKARHFSNAIWQQLDIEGVQTQVRSIQNEAGEVFEAYDLSDITDASRAPKVPKEPE